MYSEETLSSYIETINCADGDCLILAFDMIDIETGNSIIAAIEEKMPGIKVVGVPADTITGVLHLKRSPRFSTEPILPVDPVGCYTDEEMATWPFD